MELRLLRPAEGPKDIGGADYDYRYNHARQLSAESNDRPNLAKNIAYHYDAAGQLTHIQDITHALFEKYFGAEMKLGTLQVWHVPGNGMR